MKRFSGKKNNIFNRAGQCDIFNNNNTLLNKRRELLLLEEEGHVCRPFLSDVVKSKRTISWI